MKNSLHIFLCIFFLLTSCYALNKECKPSKGLIPHTRSEIKELNEIYAGRSLDSFYRKYGEPQGDVGSGIFIFQYMLQDGTPIYVGSADNKTILYVK